MIQRHVIEVDICVPRDEWQRTLERIESHLTANVNAEMIRRLNEGFGQRTQTATPASRTMWDEWLRGMMGGE